MSTSLYIYSVRIDRVSSVFGSGDGSLLARIKETSPARYRIRTWDYNTFGGQERGEISIDDAIEEIVHRSISQPENAWQYGFALELICELLGVELPNDEFAYLHAGIDDILGEAGLKGTAARMLSTPRYPMPIPLIEELPLISCLTMEEAAKDLDANGGPTVRGSNSGVLSEQEKTYNRFKSWLEHAVNTQNDIITFFY